MCKVGLFLITEEMMALVDNIQIRPGYRTDHSSVELCFKITNFKRAKGFWKFNNSLLRDSEYVQKVKEVILDVKRKYALPIYNLYSIENIPDNELQFKISDQAFFEQLLLEIRGMTIPFSSLKKKKLDNKENSLIQQIQFLGNVVQETLLREFYVKCLMT